MDNCIKLLMILSLVNDSFEIPGFYSEFHDFNGAGGFIEKHPPTESSG